MIYKQARGMRFPMIAPSGAEKKDVKKAFAGPPWAARPDNAKAPFSKRTPMDDFLDKLGPRSESALDFAAMTYAMVKGKDGR
jgi:hypothetical protein